MASFGAEYVWTQSPQNNYPNVQQSIQQNFPFPNAKIPPQEDDPLRLTYTFNKVSDGSPVTITWEGGRLDWDVSIVFCFAEGPESKGEHLEPVVAPFPNKKKQFNWEIPQKYFDELKYKNKKFQFLIQELSSQPLIDYGKKFELQKSLLVKDRSGAPTANDMPVGYDKYGIEPLAIGLSDVIINMQGQPLSIALYGRWGAGKTFFLIY